MLHYTMLILSGCADAWSLKMLQHPAKLTIASCRFMVAACVPNAGQTAPYYSIYETSVSRFTCKYVVVRYQSYKPGKLLGVVRAQGLKDPEAKRKAIGAGFIQVFQEYADSFEADHGFVPRYLVQARAASPQNYVKP